MTDVSKLSREIHESEGLRIHHLLNELDTNHYVVTRNYIELQRFLDLAEESPGAFPRLFWASEANDELLVAMREVTRLLLNYLTAAVARVDNTKELTRKRFRNQEFHSEFSTESKRRLDSNGLMQFVRVLRNYSVHYSLPFAGAVTRYDEETGFDRWFALDKNRLLISGYDWARQPPLAEEYLRGCDDALRIRELTTRHFMGLDEFHEWTHNRLLEMYGGELDWLYAAETELRAALTQMKNATY